MVTVYAKEVSKEESKVEFESQKVKINLKFKDGRQWIKEIKLTEVGDRNDTINV
jgi:hypothetical protein